MEGSIVWAPVSAKRAEELDLNSSRSKTPKDRLVCRLMARNLGDTLHALHIEERIRRASNL